MFRSALESCQRLQLLGSRLHGAPATSEWSVYNRLSLGRGDTVLETCCQTDAQRHREARNVDQRERGGAHLRRSR